MISPADSWGHFVAQPGCKSAGVMGATKHECTDQKLPVVADGEPFPEHASIDFTEYEESDIKKKAKVLARDAQVRGWLHQEPVD